MENMKTNYQYLHTDGNWYPIEIKKCDMTRARGTINQGRPYQPVYIKDGKECTIRYRRVTVESAIAELRAVVEQHGDGTCNGKRYRVVSEDAPETAPDAVAQFRLFVYGTLQRGYWNHDRFCRDAVSIETATVIGQLYQLPSGIPVLQVPESYVIMEACSNVYQDLLAQEQAYIENGLPLAADSSWRLIYGELLCFDAALPYIHQLDRLEGFTPNAPSLYSRVLLRAHGSHTQSVSAWAYICKDPRSWNLRELNKASWP